ncbi:MAG: response regulator [Pontibacter sp.]|nr:response regulator [Pontibacter sp.]
MFKSVFIVDDDEVSIFLAEAMLSVEAFAQQYCTFQNPSEALQKLMACLQQDDDGVQLPDIIFLDLNMPFMSGWDFLDALSPYAEKLSRHTRIYILTSSVDADEMKRSKGYSFLTGFLHKPMEEDTIRKIMAEARR